ncbi:MAG: hypothetical protein A2X49_03340 [Lentisphaerae bacterium GWF2_52_8]|nr:MAG: hypothetical protein A2X49_03340 [Lentisphaerae bacterium GWF2_52_8]
MSSTIESFTPTLCEILGIPLPSLCNAAPLQKIIRAARTSLNGKIPQRCLLFAPDAIGTHLGRKIPGHFAKIREITPFGADLRAVLPAKTPVCFASMFTGAPPEKHGIQSYEKPVLTCDTLFDALLREGKRIAIVSVRNSSIDLIFRKRAISYFSEDYDHQVTSRAISLIEAGEHDVILAYQQEYDDTLHASTPSSEKALQAAKNHFTAFMKIAQAFNEQWRKCDRLIAFIPDHGAYVAPGNGRGSHGEDITDGMELKHFYGFYPAEK